MVKIGVLSDTHGRFDPALERHFKGVDMIVHAGDIGKIEVIERLRDIAPVFAVEGNNDSFGRFPEQRVEVVDGRRILIRHIFGELHQIGAEQKDEIEKIEPDIVIFGHSHKPYEARLGRVLLFNPGSAGPRRFSLPRTAGFLTIADDRVTPRIINLG